MKVCINFFGGPCILGVFVVFVIQHAMRMCHTVICGLPDSTIFFPRYLTKDTTKKKKKVIRYKMLIFIFSTNSSGIFLILRITERDMIYDE